MATIPLVDRYRRYKRGTDKLIEWLTSSAKRAVPTPAVHRPLHVDDLVVLAQSVCEIKPALNIPQEILLVTSDVIDGRRICANFYAGLDPKTSNLDTDLGKRNKSHRYFISILESVQRLLQVSAHAVPKKSAKSRKVDEDGKSVLNNLFVYLDLGEPAPAAMLDSQQSSNQQKARPAPKVVLDNEEEDLSFALWCFLKDAQDIRKFAKGLWSRYYQGEITFAVATQTTEMAFVMIRDLQNQMTLNTNGKTTDMASVVHMLGMDMFRGPDGNYFCSFNDVNVPENRREEASELFCLRAAMALGQFCNEEDDKAMMWAADHHFTKALFSIREDIKILAKKGDHNTGEIEGVIMDEFTRTILPILSDKVVLLSSVMQAQIYMDMFDAIGACQTIGRDFGGSKLRMLQAEVKNYCEQETEVDEAKWLQSISSKMEGYFSPKTNARRTKIVSKLPLLPAKMVNDNIRESRRISCSAASQRLIILSIAYLYHAARCYGVLNREWHDLDFLIADQSIHGAFVRPANSLEGYARHYDLAIGVKASVFSRNGSRSPPMPSLQQISTKFKKLRPTSPLLMAALDKGVTEKLENMKPGEWGPGQDPQYAMLHIIAGRTANRTAKSLPPVDLLSALEKGLVASEPAFNFDCLTLYARCKSFINDIISFFPDRLPRVDHNGPVGTHKFVNDVLWEAATAERLGKPKEDTILFEVGRAFGDMLDKNGSDCLLKASHKRSSGHIPEERWPCKQHSKGGLPAQLKGMMNKIRDDADPNQRRYDTEHSEVMQLAEKQRRKWESNGVRPDIVKRKLVSFVNAEFTKRGVPRKAEPRDDEHLYAIVRTQKPSMIEDMLSRVQIGEMTTVGELMKQGAFQRPHGPQRP